jgi:hypothetical protein
MRLILSIMYIFFLYWDSGQIQPWKMQAKI